MYTYATFAGILIDGLGMLILGWHMRSPYALWQGVAQFVVALLGMAVISAHMSLAWVVLWLFSILVMFVGRCLLRAHLGNQRLELSAPNPPSARFWLELVSYFLLSMIVVYSHRADAAMVPVWGRMCWAIAFGGSVVMLFTLGGVGLSFVGLRSIQLLLRVVVPAGVVALMRAYFH